MTRSRRAVLGLGRWVLLLVVSAYVAYALGAAWAEVIKGVEGTVAGGRSAPVPFILHAVTGAFALLGGALQFGESSGSRRPRLHRMTGRLYSVGVLVSGITALRLSVTFAVPLPARLSFAMLALVWIGSTLSAVHRARRSNTSAHREWAIRSYALTLFFVTGSVWIAVVDRMPVPYGIAYPLAVTLGWGLNLLAAEMLILRRRRAPSSAPSAAAH